MPRLYVLSDLHREFAPFQASSVDADVVVLAGDIDHGTKGLEWARVAFPKRPIIYVAGNHEYYGAAIPHLTERLRHTAGRLGIHFLENASIDIAGLHFLGCTLWTDLGLFGPQPWIADAVQQVLLDYRTIRVSPQFRRLRPADTASWCQRSVRWLREELNSRSGPAVVVTHHAPSARSLAPQHADDPVSAGFASRLDDLVQTPDIRLWVHGHTHFSVDYQLGGTRVLSNQKGYADERNTGFRPDLVVEL